MNIQEERARQVWAVLIKYCGACADENMILQFLQGLKNTRQLEFRFQGTLGFGGKILVCSGEQPHVYCYLDDETKERKRQISKANAALIDLYNQWEEN